MAVLTEEQKIIIGITVGVAALVLLWIIVFICCIHYGKKRRILHQRNHQGNFTDNKDYNGYIDGRPYMHKRFFNENFISNNGYNGSMNGRPYSIYEKHITHTDEAPDIPPPSQPNFQHHPPAMRNDEYYKKTHSKEQTEMRHDSWDRKAEHQPAVMSSDEYYKKPLSAEQIEMRHDSWDRKTIPRHVEKRYHRIYEKHITHTDEAPDIPPPSQPNFQHHPPAMRNDEYYKKTHSKEQTEMRHDSWDRKAEHQPAVMSSDEYYKKPLSAEQIEMRHDSWDRKTIPRHVEKRYHRTYEQEVAPPYESLYIPPPSHSQHILQAPALRNEVYYKRPRSLERVVMHYDSLDRRTIPQHIGKRYYSDDHWNGAVRTDPTVVQLKEPEYVVNDIGRREQDVIYLKYADDQALLPRTNHYRRANYGEMRRSRSFTDHHRISPYGGEWYRRPDHFEASKYRYIDDQAALPRTNYYRKLDNGAIRRSRSFTDLQGGTYPYVGEWNRRPEYFEFNKHASKAGRDPYLWTGYQEMK